MNSRILWIFTTILTLAYATTNDKSEKPFFERLLLNKLDYIAHIPKRIPQWKTEKILDKIPFYGEAVEVVPHTHPYLDANAIENVYLAPTKHQ